MAGDLGPKQPSRRAARGIAPRTIQARFETSAPPPTNLQHVIEDLRIGKSRITGAADSRPGARSVVRWRSARNVEVKTETLADLRALLDRARLDGRMIRV